MPQTVTHSWDRVSVLSARKSLVSGGWRRVHFSLGPGASPETDEKGTRRQGPPDEGPCRAGGGLETSLRTLAQLTAQRGAQTPQGS